MNPDKILCLLLALASVACPLQANADQLQEVNAFMEERWRVFEDRDAEGTVNLYTELENSGLSKHPDLESLRLEGSEPVDAAHFFQPEPSAPGQVRF